MMKKNGFTLAEVLITLAIIGVVATLTLPSLISNTQEQQAVTAFRKAMNTLNETAQMNAAIDGFDYGGIAFGDAPAADAVVYNANGILRQSVWAMMSARAQVDVTRSGTPAAVYGAGAAGACTAMSNVISFRDGTMLCYMNTITNNAANAVINAVIDTNGIKSPNAVSSCNNALCSDKANKIIRDQFEITLYNATAIPGRVTVAANGTYTDAGTANNNNASRWAMSK